jgi:predicted  nucleic acid-binding Zn-ribbon protein
MSCAAAKITAQIEANMLAAANHKSALKADAVAAANAANQAVVDLTDAYAKLTTFVDAFHIALQKATEAAKNAKDKADNL